MKYFLVVFLLCSSVYAQSWDTLSTPTERIAYLRQVLAQDSTDALTLPSCDAYAKHACASIRNYRNVPVCYAWVLDQRGVDAWFHAFNAVFVGDDADDIDSWCFFEPQTDAIQALYEVVTDPFGVIEIFDYPSMTLVKHFDVYDNHVAVEDTSWRQIKEMFR